MVFATPRVKSNSKGKTKVTGLQVQNSAYGLALPVVYGTTRISGNLGWYGGFHSVQKNNPSSGGGKGGFFCF